MNITNLKVDTSNKVSIDSSEQTIKATTQMTPSQDVLSESLNVNEMTDRKGKPTSQAYQTAVNKLNEFMEYSKKESKFIFHEDLERYYVELVDSKTKEVIKEIPPKELLDAYYEMQKLVGKMFDTQA